MDRFGIALSEAQADGIEEANDALSRLALIGKGLGNQLTASLAPVLKDLADRAAGLSDWFNGLSDSTQRFVSVGALIAGVAGPAAMALGMITMALIPLATPLGAVVIGLGALAAGAAYVAYRWDDLVARFPMLSSVSAGLGSVWEAVKRGWELSWTGISRAWDVLGENFELGIGAIKALIDGDFALAAQSMQTMASNTATFLSDAFGGLWELVQPELIQFALDAKAWAEGLPQKIADGLASLGEKVSQRFTELSPVVSAALADLRAQAAIKTAEIAASIGDGLATLGEAAAQAIKDMGARMWAEMKAIAANAFAEAKNIGGYVVDGIKAGIDEKWQSLKAKVSSVGSSISDGFKKILRTRSPSKVTTEIGGFVVDGLIVGMASGQAGLAKTAADVAGTVTSVFDTMVSDVSRSVGDFFAGLGGGVSGAIASIKSALQRGLSSVISGSLSGGLSSVLGLGGGVPAVVGPQVGDGGLLGSAGSLLSGGPLAGLLGSFGEAGSIFGLGGLGGGSGFLGGLGSAISGGIGNIFNITGNIAAAGGGLAASIGAVVPILGIAAAAFSFFRKKVKLLDSGLRVTVDGMSTLVETFSKKETSRFFGLSKKVRETFTAAADAVAAPLRNVVSGIQQGVLGAALALGVGSSAFADFAYEMKVSTKGLSDSEAQAAVEDALESLGDAFAGMVPGLEDAAQAGEGALDTLNRISGHLTAVNSVMDTLAHRLFDVSVAGGAVASEMVTAFGGLDAFSSATSAYFAGFYTQQERFDTAVRQLEGRFEELNVAMPQTRAQFRAMIEGLDTTTEYGRQMYAALMLMSGALNEVLPAIASFSVGVAEMVGSITTEIDAMIGTTSEAMRANEQAASLWYRTASTLRDFIADMRGTAGALVSGQQARAFSEMRFQTLLSSALAGDNQAATELTTAARNLLSNTMATARTALEQARTEARVLSDLQLTAGVSDIEGARHDVIAGLLGNQVTLLEEVRAAINSGNPLEPAVIEGLNAQLGSLQGAIAAAEMINYQFLKERLSVSVDLIADADIPASLRTMLDNAATGITANIDYIARTASLMPDLRWLALTAASEHIKTIDYVLGDDISASNRWIATTTVSSLSKTLNLTIGKQLTSDQLRIALAGSSEMSRVVNVSLSSDASNEAIRLALGNINRYQVIVAAAMQSNLSGEVQRLVIAQQGDYAAIIGAAISADMTDTYRRILLERQGTYIARIGAVLETAMPDAHRLLLLNANTSATRAITILMGYGQHLTHSERALLIRESDRITRTIDAAVDFSRFSGRDWTLFSLGNSQVSKTVRGDVGLVNFNGNKWALLHQSTEAVDKLVRGSIDLSGLTGTQAGFLRTITGTSTGRITLGGSFEFDPSTGFSTWFASTTRSNITNPITALREGMAGLRGSLGELAQLMRDEARERAEEAARTARIGQITAQVVNSTWGSDAQNRSSGVIERIRQLERDTGVTLMQGDSAAQLGLNAQGGINYNASHVDYGRGADIAEFRRRFWADGGLEDQIGSANQNILNRNNWLAGLRRQVVDLGGIPAFATGGLHRGGLRIVGENGPELEATGRSRIYNADTTKRMLGGNSEEVVKELRALRKEVAELKAQERDQNSKLIVESAKNRAANERRNYEEYDRPTSQGATV
ncbi:phage tail protein [Sulfitobacter sp. HI0027]|uniref:phage tail protein n=1 Tax=Sulfitobacter sp. HI0027 TaxID=1822226 RepID=UPI00123782C6|nr:hypothetical protein [Sulfitobacter sp. HI0027]